MRINAITNQENITFKSKIRETNTLGFGINRAIDLGDKGFLNAIKHLANDGLKREIVVGGSNISNNDCVSAYTLLRAGDVEYELRTTHTKTPKIDGFQLMGENVIELIKKLAKETNTISKEALNQKATTKELIKETNELYRTVFIG